VGMQYYNLLSENLTDENKILPFLNRFGIRKGVGYGEGIIQNVKTTDKGILIDVKDENDKVSQQTLTSSEILDLILSNVALTASEKQKLQLQLLQNPIELPSKETESPTKKLLENLGNINIRNPFYIKD
jgi:hypothetical protein